MATRKAKTKRTSTVPSRAMAMGTTTATSWPSPSTSLSPSPSPTSTSTSTSTATSTATPSCSPSLLSSSASFRMPRVRERFVYIVCGIVCLLHLQQQHIAGAFGADEQRAVVVGRSAHEPKFGERLLPLLRKKHAFNTFSASKSISGGFGGVGGAPVTMMSSSGSRASSPLLPNRSVNSFLNKSNYFVSHEEATDHQQQPQERERDARERRPKTFDNEIAVETDAGARPTEEPELYTIVAMTTLEQPAQAGDYEAPRRAAQPSRRQSKQLRRREDVNIDAVEDEEPAAYAVRSSNISKADRLVVMSTEFFVVPTSSTPAPSSVSSTSATPRLGAKSRGMPAHIQPPHTPQSGPRSVLIVAPKTTTTANSSATQPTIVSTQPTFTGLRKEPWVVPVLVLAALTMLMMAAFEIFVLFKAWRTSPSRRHLFLGQMLLLGLFACAGLGAVITAQPSLLTCGTIRFGVGVAYALVFAALLVKCVFLISLNGGVYLPAPYQGLLLLFAVLIQVAIGAQWLLTQPPEIYTLSVPVIGSSLLASSTLTSSAHTSADAALPVSSSATSTSSLSSSFSSSSSLSSSSSFAALFHPGTHAGGDLYARISATGTVLIPLCKTQFSELLFSLIYIVFLIVFVAVLAIKSRGIRDNYREATYIGLAIGGAIPIWLGWMLCGLAVAERHKDACIAFGLIATSATVFLVMFMPKGRQLAAMGKEGLYVEDREEQFSSLSRAGSGYSPSFFHFKPIKYGVMSGGMPNSATNTGNGASMKHCSNGMSGGDRVALVTAAPPSYTRMYHYFPAHLTTHHPTFCFYPHQPPPPLPPQAPPPPPPLTQLPSPPTLKQLGNSLASMTQAHIAQTLRYPGLFIRPDETNLYTTLEPTLSSNPNVYFQRGGAVHPGMMY